MFADIERFGMSRFYSHHKICSMRSVFEELVGQMIFPFFKDDFKIRIIVEHIVGTGCTNMVIEYTGGKFDPFENGDEISMAIINSKITSYSYEYENTHDSVYNNRITLSVKG